MLAVVLQVEEEQQQQQQEQAETEYPSSQFGETIWWLVQATRLVDPKRRHSAAGGR
jgi:hypothetical protein